MFSKTLHPSFVARGLTLGSAFSIFYGTLWVINGIRALNAPLALVLSLFAILALCSGSLAVACIRLFLSASLFPTLEHPQAIKRANWYINIATLVQVVISVGGPSLCIYLGYTNFVFPLIVVSVGLYLLALAPLFHVAHYYIAGTLLCLIPIVVIALIPMTGDGIDLWMVINGLIGGLVFLGSGLTNMLLTVSLRRGHLFPLHQQVRSA